MPIPKYDPDNSLPVDISEAGEAAAAGAANKLEELRLGLQREEKPLTVTVARRELRAWLRVSDQGAAVESAVDRLLR